MKTKFFLAAALLMGTATLASAQITPTSPQRAGAVNQSTVPPINPANPTTNPGTLDQRTSTTASPTQQGVIGTIDQSPQPPRPITTEQELRQPARPTRVAPRARRQTTAPRGTLQQQSTTPITPTDSRP
ncbi:hypothetical protein HNQ93_003403 [Hymenobacter luteus]|uniref:Uncharacterized protein n=2 Tax=Hymenobacter TaxID=89966 RepID=A0A7W9T526_9BACT|nr:MULTISPECIES: hypothetical protein [Hymenobacter]MBB4602638.1 hypothetical protein [Hymenobacter latericoloratus]MBB6060529.1 hypothetical protein [Hymenobacter luteus]